MKRILSVLILTITFICFTACGTKKAATDPADLDNQLFGTWTESYFDSGYIFNEDGTGKDTFWDLPFTYTAKEGKIRIIYDDEMWGTSSYSYSVESDSLFMTQNGSNETYEYTRTP